MTLPPCPAVETVSWHLSIGVWIGVLALLGVVVPFFRGEAKRNEKAVWSALMCLFLYLEVRSIRLEDRKSNGEHEHALCEESRNFQAVVDRLEDANKKRDSQYQSTMDSVDSVSEKTQGVSNMAAKSVLAITGGDSYLYGRPIPITDTKGVLIYVHNNGKAQLSSTTVQVSEVTKDCDSWATECSISAWSGHFSPESPGTIAGGAEVLSMVPLRPKPDGTHHYLIQFTAQNGVSVQDVWLRNSRDGLHTAYRFMVRQTLANKKQRLVLRQDWTEPDPVAAAGISH